MIKRLSDGLVAITGTAAVYCGMWQRTKARKVAYYRTCRFSGRAIVAGDLVYRPMTNGDIRNQRLLADEVERRIDG